MKLSDLVPGGAHTYSRSDDCFPANAPDFLCRAKGCRVWDDKGKEYIDYGMSLRSVVLGYCHPAVDNAVKEAIDKGISFTRPSMYEMELAELMHSIIPCAEMVKFGKNGSDATSAAVKLARAYTGRDTVLIAEENPFISQHNWFIGKTEVNGGILYKEYGATKKYSYNEIPMDLKKWDIHLHDIAAIILDPSTVDITREKLQYIRELCDEYGIVMILDEVISGFRYGISGVQGLLGVTPDLATFGKAMGNGYSISALCGKKDIMKLGDRQYGDVFLMSGTHFSETTGYAAALAAINEMKTLNVSRYILSCGQHFCDKLILAIREAKMDRYIEINDWYACNPSMRYSGDDNVDSLEVKTLFDQCMIKQGVLMPYIAPSLSHTAAEINKTVEAAERALGICRKAIDEGDISKYLIDGHCEKPVFRKHRR